MVATERLAIYQPWQSRQRDDRDVERRSVLCVACGRLLGMETTHRFTDATHTYYSLLPGYRENAVGIYIRKRPPRRGQRVSLDESWDITAARYYEPNEFGDMVGTPVVVHEHHPVGVTRRPPFTIECSWKLCKERNLIMGR